MKNLEPVKNIMSENVLSVEEDDSLKSVFDLFRKNQFRHLPVTKGNEITGIISRTDIDRLSFGALFDNQEEADDAVLEMLSIPQVMSNKPVVVKADTPVKEVAETFAKGGFHALAVVEGKALKGIVTTTDVIKFMLKEP